MSHFIDRFRRLIEIITPGAFKDSLSRGKDVVALVDHDMTRVLARTKSGTLKLSEDSKGLQFDLSLPQTTTGLDVLELATRGDLSGMSFGFFVPEGGERRIGNRRELRSVNLVEISVISGAQPAYEGTTVNPRAKTPRLNLARLYLETCRWEF